MDNELTVQKTARLNGISYEDQNSRLKNDDNEFWQNRLLKKNKIKVKETRQKSDQRL